MKVNLYSKPYKCQLYKIYTYVNTLSLISNNNIHYRHVEIRVNNLTIIKTKCINYLMSTQHIT